MERQVFAAELVTKIVEYFTCFATSILRDVCLKQRGPEAAYADVLFLVTPAYGQPLSYLYHAHFEGFHLRVMLSLQGTLLQQCSVVVTSGLRSL
jgi:hypothetical protein